MVKSSLPSRAPMPISTAFVIIRIRLTSANNSSNDSSNSSKSSSNSNSSSNNNNPLGGRPCRGGGAEYPSGFAPDGEARSRPGVTVAGGPRGLQEQRVGPMMGDTPSGVVARRIQPSGVTSFGRVTQLPRSPEPCTERYDGHYYICPGRRLGAPKWVPGVKVVVFSQDQFYSVLWSRSSRLWTSLCSTTSSSSPRGSS